jgi:twitching motility protein PilT
MATLPELLKTLVDMDGSDLHIATDTPPQVRVHGDLQRLQMPTLAPAETKQLVYSVLTDSQKKRFEETLELDFSFGIKGLARFRCNVFNQRGAVGAVYRLIPEKIRPFGELGLPPVLATLYGVHGHWDAAARYRHSVIHGSCRLRRLHG